MLVIGIVLFVGYSLTQLGPTGKVTIGVLLGVTLLGARCPARKTTSLENVLIQPDGGGLGSAVLHSVRRVGNPCSPRSHQPDGATMLLIVVSAAMIAHSVAYESETATALAWLLGFVGLNVSPPTTFALVAGVVLAISITVVAHRYRWPSAGPRSGLGVSYVCDPIPRRHARRRSCTLAVLADVRNLGSASNAPAGS